jgi:DNA polymerase III gamma/tau subunit
VDSYERLARDAGRLPLEAIQKYVGAIQSARQQVEQNVNERLALEVMLLGMPVLSAV